MEAVAEKEAQQQEQEAPKRQRFEVKMSGLSVLFIWKRTGEASAPSGEALDVIGMLRHDIRTVASVAQATSKEKGWAKRRFTVSLTAPDQVFMLWSLIDMGAKGGEDIDAAFSARNSLRPLYKSVAGA